MATFPTVTVNGEEVLLLDAAPDRSAPIKLTLRMETDVQRSETLRETRTPLRPYPRTKMEYRLGLEDGNAAAWRTALATIGTKRVAVPVWPDARLRADLSGALYDARYWVNVNTGAVVDCPYIMQAPELHSFESFRQNEQNLFHESVVVDGDYTSWKLSRRTTVHTYGNYVYRDCPWVINRRYRMRLLARIHPSTRMKKVMAIMFGGLQTDTIISNNYTNVEAQANITATTYSVSYLKFLDVNGNSFNGVTDDGTDDIAYIAKYTVQDIDAMNATDLYAPLLIGRIEERPEGMVITGKAADWSKVTIREDGPEATALKPRDTAIMGGTWPAALTPDAATIKDLSADLLELDSLGRSGQQLLQGREAPMRWGQEGVLLASSTEIPDLLSFFCHRSQGRYGDFTLPAWFKPHTIGTDETPDAYRARFGSDELTLVFDGGNDWATAKIRLWQLPWELNLPEGEAPLATAVAYLYQFSIDVPGGPLYYRYTDHAKSLQYGGNTYAPALIGHDKIKLSWELGDSRLSLSAEATSGHPLLKQLLGQNEGMLYLHLYQCDPANAASARLRFHGPVGKVGAVERKLKAEFYDVFRIKAPRLLITKREAFAPFSPEGGRNRASYARTGTVASVNGTQVYLSAISGGDPAAQYFAGGWAEKGTGSTFERREIVNHDYPSGKKKVDILRPWTVPPTPGSTITLYPGSDGTWTQAKTLFAASSDYQWFSGFPYLPPDKPNIAGNYGVATKK